MHELPQPLLARTYRLLELVGASYGEIAEGARVDKNWVAKFVTKAIAEPGVHKVQRVHDFLLTRATPEQLAVSIDPSHHQTMGSAGNG